jgi:hypothetical protein
MSEKKQYQDLPNSEPTISMRVGALEERLDKIIELLSKKDPASNWEGVRKEVEVDFKDLIDQPKSKESKTDQE